MIGLVLAIVIGAIVLITGSWWMLKRMSKTTKTTSSSE